MFRIFLDVEDFVGIGKFNDHNHRYPYIYTKRTWRTKIQMADSRVEERQESEEVIIDCMALFYEEGKGGENYRKKINLGAV